MTLDCWFIMNDTLLRRWSTCLWKVVFNIINRTVIYSVLTSLLFRVFIMKNIFCWSFLQKLPYLFIIFLPCHFILWKMIRNSFSLQCLHVILIISHKKFCLKLLLNEINTRSGLSNLCHSLVVSKIKWYNWLLVSKDICFMKNLLICLWWCKMKINVCGGYLWGVVFID